MSKPMELECVVRSSDEIGEVPIWCERTNKLWWIDVRRALLQSFDPATGAHEQHAVGGGAIGCFALRESGGMVVAQDDGIYAFTPGQGPREKLIDPEADRRDNRFNDGRCDRLGRLWVGSMNMKVRNEDGQFWRIDTDLSARVAFGEANIPNGVCFSPDDKTLYYVDSRKKAMWAFDFHLEEGEISNRRVLVDLSNNPAVSDGSTVDAEGFIWNCEFFGGRIVRYAPDGRIDRVVEMPVSNVTSAGFGGPALDVLYVTTATRMLTPEQLEREPLAGGLFRLDVGVKGLPEPRFRA